MHRLENKNQLNYLIGKFEGSKYFTNFFFFGSDLDELIKREELFFVTDGFVLLFLFKNSSNKFYKLYYFIGENSIPFDFSVELPVVLEIPHRTQKYPIAEIKFLLGFGFTEHIKRDLMTLSIGSESNFEGNIAEMMYELKIIEDIHLAQRLLEGILNAFDIHSGDVLSLDEVIRELKDRHFIGVFNDGYLVGFLRYYVKSKIAWIGHLVVFGENKGQGIGELLVRYFVRLNLQNGISNYMHWVVSDNFAAIRLYNKCGYKFLGKSSISMIKK
jgi:GNAT superfamily N-acetyltransferase